MTTQTPAQRKAAERARKRGEGKVLLELWVKPEHKTKLISLFNKLTGVTK